MSDTIKRIGSRDVPGFLPTGGESATPAHVSDYDRTATWTTTTRTGTTAAPTLSTDGESCRNARAAKLMWHTPSAFTSATVEVYVYNEDDDVWSQLYSGGAVRTYTLGSAIPRADEEAIPLEGWDRVYLRYTSWSGTSIDESIKLI